MKKPRVTYENFKTYTLIFLSVACAFLLAFAVCAGIAENADYKAEQAALQATVERWVWDDEELSENWFTVDDSNPYKSYAAIVSFLTNGRGISGSEKPVLRVASLVCFAFFIVFAAASALVALVFFNRCPHCGASYGRGGWLYDHCRGCGAKKER
ncbi:MAG: hypothetical protein LBN00_02130 [Oscillospiraceae bacterium]|jgi:hypothetical protein|nr:hypothetical protein [Oscillospiraceae bacterium]